MKIRSSLRLMIAVCALALGLAAARQPSRDGIPAAEFSKIIQSFSEKEGYFLSDNLISNEDGYLSIVNKIRELRLAGGAYIGVGPEQNFTYIAKTRPSIAFLVDIRREAMIQHLMYKALFHISRNRSEFLSRLLGRPLRGKEAPTVNVPIGDLLDLLSATPADDSYCASNLAEMERIIQSEFRFPLSGRDRDSLARITKSFCTEGLELSFQFQSVGRGGRFFMPSMRDLLEQTGPDGKPGNFLASTDDYQFVRNLHEKNKIIPVVGDFAGPKALKSIARYLKDHSYKVNVFYTSNVEMYLFQTESFDGFAKNVQALPITSRSLFIRSANNNRGRWGRQGYRMSTLLQYISVFLKDYQDGLYTDYWTLVSTHFIPLKP